MTQLKLILAAILAIFGRLFTLPTLTARRGDNKRRGFNILPALCALCFSAIISNAAFTFGHLSSWPLHQAVEKGDITEVERLIDSGANIEEIYSGFTPLQGAIYPKVYSETRNRRHNIIAMMLIKAGANVHVRYHSGDYVLHVAMKEGLSNTAIALIDAGANINAQGNNGHTALHIVASNRWDSDNATALAIALIERGADVNARNNFGETPLDRAISANGRDGKIARLLLKKQSTWDRIKGWLFGD